MLTWWKRWRSQLRTRNAPSKSTGARAVLPLYSITAHTLTDVGSHRTANEDCIQYVAASRQDGLLLVADGMGGHAAGEVASRMVVEHVCDAYTGGSHSGLHTLLQSTLADANRAIHAAAGANEAQRGMGTTCMALAVHEGRAYCAYVGDSRLYLLRAETLYQMSEDHSLVRQLINQGLLTPEEAHYHGDTHVVLRALGTRPAVDITTWPTPFPVQPGDCFIACSDGLYDLVDDATLQRIVQRHTPEAACKRLVEAANANGGFDNISVGILRIQAMRPAPSNGHSVQENSSSSKPALS